MLAGLVAVLCATIANAQPATSTRRVIRPAGAPADRPYSPGVMVGKTLYISGQLGVPGSGATPADLKAQTRQAMDGIGTVLKAAGLGYEHLVKCQVYLANMDDYSAMNEVYGSYFTDRVPARTTVQAAALPARAGIEIGCIGYADLAGISVVRPPAGSLPAPLGPYSPAVWAGETLYVSGMGGQDPATRSVAEPVGAQVMQTLANIQTTLKAAGLGLGDVVSAQAYLTRLDEADQMVAAFGAAFEPVGTLPPRGVVGLPRLPGPIKAELTFIAAKPSVTRTPLGSSGQLYGLVAGSTLYVSPEAAPDEGPGFDAQARATFASLRGTLQDAGLTWRDVASVTVYLSDLADMPAMNAMFTEFFSADPPARVTIQVQPQGKERIRVGLIAAR
jgi:2-iminobutanoate/2-iminopropanoate deaminase